MPLPWKKKPRSARISGLLADLQAPPRRGGSLVVQTGFPTSLIDLFVKNRDRLWKSPKRTKHSRRGRHPTSSAADPPLLDPLAADPPSLAAPQAHFREDGAGAELPCTDDRPRPPEPQDEGVDESAPPPVPTAREIPYEKGCADRRPLAVLMVFAVVALALCTKGLAMGITIPAVVLLFLEHMGIVIPRLWKHWKRADDVPNSRYKRGPFVFEGTEKCLLTEEEVAVVERCNSDGAIKTIGTGTGAAVPGQEVDSVGPDPEPQLLIPDRRSGCLDAETETTPASQVAKKKPKVLKRIAMRKKSRNPNKGETIESRS